MQGLVVYITDTSYSQLWNEVLSVDEKGPTKSLNPRPIPVLTENSKLFH